MTNQNADSANGETMSKMDTTTTANIAKFCEWFEAEPPVLSYEDGSILLDDVLLNWCNDNGVSLDWLFVGEVKIMAMAYREKHIRERPFRELVNEFDRVEQGMLLDALKASEEGGDLEEQMVAFKAAVQDYRINKSR